MFSKANLKKINRKRFINKYFPKNIKMSNKKIMGKMSKLKH